MNDTCISTTGNTTPISIEAIAKAMQEINLFPKPDKWVLIDPQGRVYVGKVEDVTRILMMEHPLLKLANTPPSFV